MASIFIIWAKTLCDLALWSEKTEGIPVARWVDTISPLPRFIHTNLEDRTGVPPVKSDFAGRWFQNFTFRSLVRAEGFEPPIIFSGLS